MSCEKDNYYNIPTKGLWIRLIFSSIFFLLLSCKKNINEVKKGDDYQTLNYEKELDKSVDYYSELSNEESKMLNTVYKVNCVENTNNKSYPALIGLHPISDFYIDLFNSKEMARILASAYKKNNIDSIYYLKYSMLTGITRYNQQLNWHKISGDSIIAKIEIINNERIKLWWYGFYDIEQKKWLHQKSDFNIIAGDNPVVLKKCQ